MKQENQESGGRHKEKIWASRRSSRLVWGLRPKLIYVIRTANNKKAARKKHWQMYWHMQIIMADDYMTADQVRMIVENAKQEIKYINDISLDGDDEDE